MNATKHLKIFLEYFQEHNQTLENIFCRTKYNQCKNIYVQYIGCSVYITPLRHGRMHIWLNLDLTRGTAVSKGKGSCSWYVLKV